MENEMENEVDEEVGNVVENDAAVAECDGLCNEGVPEGCVGGESNGGSDGESAGGGSDGGLSFERLVSVDRRVAHMLVDIGNGDDAEVAAARYFGRASEAELAAAEERGYARGKNEAIELKMRSVEETPMILNGMRRGWWE
jgi:hypothetical protein